MSNYLIDRMDAIENIWSLFNNTYNDSSRFDAEETVLAKRILSDVQMVLEKQPTAYDVEKVIERLEHDTEIALKRYMNCNADTLPVTYTRYSTQYKERRKCLEIVKQCGREPGEADGIY